MRQANSHRMAALLGVVMLSVYAGAHVQALEAEAVDLERLDYTRRVGPFAELPSEMFDAGMLDLDWVEVERHRLDAPAPPPPVVPPGLQGILWAFSHVSDAWRLVFPIPPEQAPVLVLAADPHLDTAN